MTPDLENLKAFLGNLQGKSIPEISQACAEKIRSMEIAGNPDRALTEHLKSIILLVRHLRRPDFAKDDEMRRFLISFFSQVLEYDKRAKHPLEILSK
ncbi:MAG: hypothetical protein ACPLRH_03790 [Desulfotomaculales bacterium]